MNSPNSSNTSAGWHRLADSEAYLCATHKRLTQSGLDWQVPLVPTDTDRLHGEPLRAPPLPFNNPAVSPSPTLPLSHPYLPLTGPLQSAMILA